MEAKRRSRAQRPVKAGRAPEMIYLQADY